MMRAVWDIETEGWDRFVLGGLLDSTGFRCSWDERVFADWLLGLEGRAWAHNGGRFDFLWLVGELDRRRIPARIICSGSAILSLRVGAVEHRDSYAVLPFALADLGKMVGLTKASTGLRCRCGQDCGGYCAIRRKGMTRRERDLLSEYLERDCRVLGRALDELEARAEQHGLVLRGTLGGTAWTSARADLGLEPARWQSSAFYDRARSGYYGGRVEVYRRRAERGYRYDIHSAYPAALAGTALPVGEPRQILGRYAAQAFRRGVPGVYRATVAVAEQPTPPLPFRHGLRIWFPTGLFNGAWSELELATAESTGARIVRIRDALVWPEAAVLFADWCSRIYKLRRADREWAGWWKLLANSLTGKFAQHPEGERFVLWPTARPRACPGGACQGGCRSDRCCDHHCSGRCGRWRLVGDRPGLWAVPYWAIPPSGHVHWAAYLTAATRIELGAQLRDAQPIYCDTDSVYSAVPVSRRLGEGLGTWGYEGELAQWFAPAPKVYRYKADGRWIARAKGLPGATAEDVARFAAGESVRTERGVVTFRSAATKGAIFRRRRLERMFRERPGWIGGRVLLADESTRAPSIGEVYESPG